MEIPDFSIKTSTSCPKKNTSLTASQKDVNFRLPPLFADTGPGTARAGPTNWGTHSASAAQSREPSSHQSRTEHSETWNSCDIVCPVRGRGQRNLMASPPNMNVRRRAHVSERDSAHLADDHQSLPSHLQNVLHRRPNGEEHAFKGDAADFTRMKYGFPHLICSLISLDRHVCRHPAKSEFYVHVRNIVATM